MLRDEIARYTELSGNDGEHTPIGIIGAFLDGYETGLKDISKREWIPVKYHEITDEERAREGYPREWIYLIDCKMPYDGQQILTTTKGGFVELDECYYDGNAYSLDSDRDWVDDVIAWQPLPEPYKGESEMIE